MIDISWLVEHGPCLRYAPGGVITCPGGTDEANKSMYILLVGHVDVYKNSSAGGLQKISTLLPGDVFGGREYFTEFRDYKYVSGTNTVVYAVSSESFNDLSWSQPDILFEIVRAAYIPLRKPLAAKASTVSSDEAQSEAKEIKAEKPAVAAVAVNDKVSSPAPVVTQTNSPALTQSEPVAVATATAASTPTAVAALGSIFPVGHKIYSDFDPQNNKQLVFPKEYTCPFCKNTFSDYRVFRSKLYEAQPMRYDLRKFFKEFVTEWYDVITCHTCLFSTFHNYFTDPKPIKPSLISEKLESSRAEILLHFEDERDINYVLTSHYLAVLCAGAYPTMDKQIRAKLWGNLSWLYEDLSDKDMEVYCARQSADVYEQIYTETRLTPVQEQITCLSIAGMQHRAGYDNNLRRYLFNAKTHQMGDKLYSKIAEDFMFELKIAEEE